jgi:hypothetical protein
MFRIFFLVLLLTLSGCNQASPDGYKFEQREWTHSEVLVTIVEHDSVALLVASAPPEAIQQGRALQAYSLIRGRDCEIHVVKPERTYAPQWLGHEMVHCLWGRFHS